MAESLLARVVLTYFVLYTTPCTDAAPDDHFVKITKLVFNSADSVRVQWNYWSVKSMSNSTDVPRTQLEVFQNESECGRNGQIEADEVALRSPAGTRDLVVWQQDSQRPVTTCIRVMVDGKWQPWESTTIQPSYHSPPYFIEQPKQPADLMSSFPAKRTVSCQYGGSPTPRWTWVINGERYNSTKTLRYIGNIKSGEELTFDRYTNIGTNLEIWLEISNEYGSAKSESIIVKKPYFAPRDCKSMNLDYKTIVNYTAGTILSCTGVDSSYPAMRHSWSFCPGENCRSLNERFALSRCNPVTFDDHHLEGKNGEHLVLPYANHEDEGCYVCDSEHPILMETCLSTINLDQMGITFNFRPKLLSQIPHVISQSDGSPEPTSVDVGDRRVLECPFQGKPAPSIEWKQDGAVVVSDDRRILSQDNMVLTIKSAESSDEGEYTCTGSNLDGSDMGRFLLHVHAVPIIKAFAPTSGLVGQNLSLFCDAEHHTSIDWFKNDNEKILDTDSLFVMSDNGLRLMVVNAQLYDSASYSCRTKNRYGKAKASTTLVVSEMVTISEIKMQMLPDVTQGSHGYQMYCNVSSDPNNDLEIEWLVDPEHCLKNEIVTRNFSQFRNTLTISVKEVPSCPLTVRCRARSGGQEVCATWRDDVYVLHDCQQDALPTEYPGTRSPPNVLGATDVSKPWYEEYLYVIVGTGIGGAVLFIAAVFTIVRFQRKKARRGASRLSSFGSGGPLIQYTRENNLNLGFVNNSLYWTSFVGENIKNQLKEVEIPRKRLTLGEMIGRGQFGRVYKGTLEDKIYWNTSGTKTVAIKTLKYKADENDMVDLFLREALMMKGFNHPHVLSLIGVTMDTDRSPLVVLPYMDRGDLRTYISSPDLDFRVLELLKMGVQVANGMSYLSAKRFIHRDLAARNCMVDKLGNVKVADFGLSRDLFTGEYYRTEEGKNPLPIRWMALESLDTKIFTTKSDVWSFGVLMWELVTRGATPYPGIENWAIARHIHQGGRMKQPLYCPNSVYAIMLECWSELPKLRPSFEALQTRLDTVTATAAAASTEAPGAPTARRGTLHMDIRSAKVTKFRGADDNLCALKEVP